MTTQATAARTDETRSRVDFQYAFAPPHRMTVGRPGASEKTLLDLEPGKLTLSWTFQDLTHAPLCAWIPPHVDWKVEVRPALDGHPFGRSTWTRGSPDDESALDSHPGYLPILDNRNEDFRGTVRLQAAGAAGAALVRVTATNRGDRPHRFSVECRLTTGWVISNPAWADPDAAADVLLAQQHERADRVLLVALGSDACPIAAKSITLTWLLAPGETRTGWLVRPYCAYAADLPALRAHDWAQEFDAAVSEWRDLLGRALKLHSPDPHVAAAYYACLGDLFIMREPLADGYTGAIMGTEVYRSSNPFEGAFAAIALDQAGLHAEAAEGLRVHLDTQEPDGQWAEPRGWAHEMWGAAGNKAWAALEHYRLTHDRAYLSQQYPRLRASARWQETQRARTRRMAAGSRPIEYGLLPRGMGDGGLMNDDDYYGVFFAHNIMAVFADRLALEAARILGHADDIPELTRIYETARADLLTALDRGAIQEAEGYRWLPGTPLKRSGSRWGVLYALYPCQLLPPDHELIEGTLRYIERELSPGGHPLHTGWMPDGCWVAISLDNVAQAHLARGNGDAAAEYLYATLNHATPLYTWCEERGVEPGTTQTSGDRQHLWTPIAFVRSLRDALVREADARILSGPTAQPAPRDAASRRMADDDAAGGLQLALGAARDWLGSGRVLGITNAPTYYGRVSYTMCYDATAGTVSGQVELLDATAAPPAWVALYIRLPHGLRVQAVDADAGAQVLPSGDGIYWPAPAGCRRFTTTVAATHET